MRLALVYALLYGVVLSQGALAARPAAPPLAPNPISVDFETPQIQGTIRTDGAYHGVTRLVDKRTGRQLIDPRYSALNLFKLMSTNQMMGQPRIMERISRRTDAPPNTPAGSLGAEIRWPPCEGHKGELVARYEVRPPNAVDLIVTLRSQGVYPGYELFLSSYFDKSLRPEVCLKTRGTKPPERVLPTVNDVFRGTVLVFPRDALAARLCLDGRWERDERRAPVVQMCPVRHYAECLAVQADAKSRLAVVLMSDPRCCYAISTRYHADSDADRLTTYSAFDLSLFGDNVVPGMELRAVVRLAVVELDDEWKNVHEAYQAFLATRGERP
jgi:hypothetical protein